MDATDLRYGGLVLLVALAVHLTDLGGASLWDRDEPRNAQCAREMLQRGDWVVPFFNDEMRDHKPVLLYWLMMGTYSVFGVNEFAARLPSALFATLTVMATFALARRIWDVRTAFWAGVALASFPLFVLVGRAATPDAALIGCSTVAIALFVWFTDDFQQRQMPGLPFPAAWWQAALIYSAMGVGVLAKGPVGLVMPTAVIGLYCLVRRLPPEPLSARTSVWHFVHRCVSCFHPGHFLRTCWSMRPLTALAMVLLIAGPWYAWVGYRTDGAWLAGFFGDHNVSRAIGAREGHQGGIWFYPLVLLVGTFPWSVLTVPAFATLRRAEQRATGEDAQQTTKGDHGLLLAFCWLVAYLLVFTLAATKLPNYVAPAYPPCALLFAVIVSQLLETRLQFSTRWLTGGLITLVVVGVATTVGLAFALAEVAPSVRWLATVGLIPLLAGLWALCARRNSLEHRVVAAVTASAFGWVFGLVIFAAVRVSSLQQTDEYFADLRAKGSTLLSVGSVEPSWVFYAGSPIKEFARDDHRGLQRELRHHESAIIVLPRAERPKGLPPEVVLHDLGDCNRFLRDEKVAAVHCIPVTVASSEEETSR